MYTDKKNILQLAVLLRNHGIRYFVLCPGSRDIPLIQTLVHVPEFACYPVTDERSAGFFAIGLSLHSDTPVAVVCTSGSALLNLHPAVAEAFYQQVPLVVISADRPAAWIGQMDGQTFPQPDVFRTLVKKSVNLPEIHTEEDEWFCNRLINEALLELTHHGRGPVHINIPISDPFFQFPVKKLPHVRTISRSEQLTNSLIEKLCHYRKRMIIIGQTHPAHTCSLPTEHFVCLSEHISNQADGIHHFDALLHAASTNALEDLTPECLITLGGHIVSKRLKQFLRKHPPQEHWHVSPDGLVTDLYGSLTTIIEETPDMFLKQLSQVHLDSASAYCCLWKQHIQALPKPHWEYSEMSAIGQVIENLPTPCALHLANSSTIRYAQLFDMPTGVSTFANRGINGIEGSISTAVGYASATHHLCFVITGDLSFFYDINALWNPNYGNNLRILVLNNDGGEIFHALPGLKLQEPAQRFVTVPHQATARQKAIDYGFEYLSARNERELSTTIPHFTRPEIGCKPILLEVFTDKESDIRLLKAYYQSIKSQH